MSQTKTGGKVERKARINGNGKKFTITKKIAKHGSQAIIVIPRILEQELKPGTIVEARLNVLDDGQGREGGEGR